MILGIPHDEIEEWWPALAPLVRKPLEHEKVKELTTDDILDRIKSRDMQCWIAHEDGQILSVGITEIIEYPQRRVLGLPFLGAVKGSIDHWFEYFEVIKDFARAHDCDVVRIWGRKGWERVMKPDHVRIEADFEV